MPLATDLVSPYLARIFMGAGIPDAEVMTDGLSGDLILRWKGVLAKIPGKQIEAALLADDYGALDGLLHGIILRHDAARRIARKRAGFRTNQRTIKARW